MNGAPNGSPRYQPGQSADVCLLLEGTFPYVRGGVSTWVKQMIEGMPHLRFSIIYLGADAATQGEPAYPLPDNVVHLEVHWLLDAERQEPTQSSIMDRTRSYLDKVRDFKAKAKRFEHNNQLHSQLKVCRRASTGKVEPSHSTEKEAVEPAGDNNELGHCLQFDVISQFTELLVGPNAMTEKELQEERGSWDTIREKYYEAPNGLDFNHYFWTVRSMHGPLFILAKIASSAPKASLYHSVSTGYAGFLGAMLKSVTATPYIISEHGIYTKERELDLAQVSWIPQELDPFKVGLNDKMSYLRNVWIRFFASLGRMSYTAADQVFTLYEGNRQRQVLDGADPSRLSIIPNGVNVERFRRVRRADNVDVPPILALIGRVVPIKDIKNFIRAMRIVNARMPEAQGWLFGPEDEDEDYTKECKTLVQSLGLMDVVKFKGFGKPEEIFPQVGLSVLTSVSEGQPLVTLEGFAAGIPAVTTDVGSCNELIYGVDKKDRALGAAGAVVPIADPAAFAEAAVVLLSDRSRWHTASRAAIARVEAYYDEVDMIARYQAEYERQMGRRHSGTVLSIHSKVA